MPAQPPVDYYAALGLDARTPPHALGAQLSHRIEQVAPGPERHLMEQARAILGDPGKRQFYDARLRDRQAPRWTPAELHQLALAPPSQSQPAGLGATLAAVPRRVLGAIAGGLVALVVLVIVLASCTGGSEDSAVAGDSETSSQRGGTSQQRGTDCGPRKNTSVTSAEWSGSSKPAVKVELVNQVPLPSELDALSAPEGVSSDNIYLRQYQDGNIGVRFMLLRDTGRSSTVATYSPDGHLIATKFYASDDEPRAFDLMRSTSHGYHHITADNGIDIPAVAAGDRDGRVFARAILPDAFDEETVWVLLRGGSDLYKGTVRNADCGAS